MKEHYVSVEQGQTLKRLGFDWECDRLWYKEFTDSDKMTLIQASADDFNHDDWDVPHCSAPRIDQVQAWLRNTKELHVLPRLESVNESCYACIITLLHKENVRVIDKDKYFPTYELALSAGIDVALELLEKERNYE